MGLCRSDAAGVSVIPFDQDILYADWITERIAVGQQPYLPKMVLALVERGITDLICCTRTPPIDYLTGTGIRILHAPQDDDGTRRDPSVVRQGVRFALDALGMGGKLYVHCAAGVNRSPLMCYGIFRAIGFARSEAIQIVSSKRTCCNFMNYPAYLESVDEALAATFR
jgi:hypothetical protein